MDVVTVLVLIKINHVFEDLSHLLDRLPFSTENSSGSAAFSEALFFILHYVVANSLQFVFTFSEVSQPRQKSPLSNFPLVSCEVW